MGNEISTICGCNFNQGNKQEEHRFVKLNNL